MSDTQQQFTNSPRLPSLTVDQTTRPRLLVSSVVSSRTTTPTYLQRLASWQLLSTTTKYDIADVSSRTKKCCR